jgi:hypothetical protein
LLKRGDKQFRRTLKPKDRMLAECRLTELRAKVGRATPRSQVQAAWIASLRAET